MQEREDEELDGEIQDHLDLLTERNIRQGMPAHVAIRVVQKQFGNVTMLRERQRAQRSFPSPPEIWGGIRFGMRMIMKSAGSAANGRDEAGDAPGAICHHGWPGYRNRGRMRGGTRTIPSPSQAWQSDWPVS